MSFGIRLKTAVKRGDAFMSGKVAAQRLRAAQNVGNPNSTACRTFEKLREIISAELAEALPVPHTVANPVTHTVTHSETRNVSPPKAESTLDKCSESSALAETSSVSAQPTQPGSDEFPSRYQSQSLLHPPLPPASAPQSSPQPQSQSRSHGQKADYDSQRRALEVRVTTDLFRRVLLDMSALPIPRCAGSCRRPGSCFAGSIFCRHVSDLETSLARDPHSYSDERKKDRGKANVRTKPDTAPAADTAQSEAAPADTVATVSGETQLPNADSDANGEQGVRREKEEYDVSEAVNGRERSKRQRTRFRLHENQDEPAEGAAALVGEAGREEAMTAEAESGHPPRAEGSESEDSMGPVEAAGGPPDEAKPILTPQNVQASEAELHSTLLATKSEPGAHLEPVAYSEPVAPSEPEGGVGEIDEREEEGEVDGEGEGVASAALHGRKVKESRGKESEIMPNVIQTRSSLRRRNESAIRAIEGVTREEEAGALVSTFCADCRNEFVCPASTAAAASASGVYTGVTTRGSGTAGGDGAGPTGSSCGDLIFVERFDLNHIHILLSTILDLCTTRSRYLLSQTSIPPTLLSHSQSQLQSQSQSQSLVRLRERGGGPFVNSTFDRTPDRIPVRRELQVIREAVGLAGFGTSALNGLIRSLLHMPRQVDQQTQTTAREAAVRGWLKFFEQKQKEILRRERDRLRDRERHARGRSGNTANPNLLSLPPKAQRAATASAAAAAGAAAGEEKEESETAVTLVVSDSSLLASMQPADKPGDANSSEGSHPEGSGGDLVPMLKDVIFVPFLEQIPGLPIMSAAASEAANKVHRDVCWAYLLSGYASPPE